MCILQSNFSLVTCAFLMLVLRDKCRRPLSPSLLVSLSWLASFEGYTRFLVFETREQQSITTRFIAGEDVTL